MPKFMTQLRAGVRALSPRLTNLSSRYLAETDCESQQTLEIQGEFPFSCSLADIAANELEFTYFFTEKEGDESYRSANVAA